ncbi:hypothetical protein [Anaerostipes sp.]|uniref:hypothetical protein n=1 Tax=Anaerostipes sp. TaxID=1872530 RepID=UPI0025C359F2|nr:hypothetical protein [Anaerostipes sp.]MBS7008805.1 hypothetical protein [Anaerostipes sp.]
MEEYKLSQKAALAGLNTLESNHNTTAKSAVVRGIAALMSLEPMLSDMDEGQAAGFKECLSKIIQDVKKLDKRKIKKIEKETAGFLKAEGVLEEVPALIACDMNYETAGVKILEYRSSETEYRKVVESVRAEVLDAGMPSVETVCLLWMFRESCLMSEFFSSSEQTEVKQRIGDISTQNECYRILFEAEFHSALGNFSTGFLKAKKNLFQNPYLEGVNLLFPFLERRSAVFIDMVVLGSTVAGRREAVLCYLAERGHYAEEVKNGSETLLRIDNSYYRIFPTTKAVYKLPVQGITLVPAYQ